MRTRTSLTLAAAASALALAGAVVPASATVQPHVSPVLTVGSVGGTPVAVNDQLSASLSGSATFYSSATGTSGVKCTGSSFSATDTTNPASPGTANESLTAQTFSGCTSNVLGASTVKSITVNNLPFNVAVTSTTDVVTVSAGGAGPIQTTVVLGTVLGTSVTCVYQGGPLTGTASNADNSISFVNQPFTLVSGPGTCFSTAYWTAKYAPVVDVTQGNGKVFVNPS